MSQRSSGGGGYKNSNLNSALSKQAPSSSSQGSLPRYSNGLVALGAPKQRSRTTPTSTAAKLAVPKPVNLPSLRKENAGNDPSTQIVPSGGGGSWQKPEEQPPAPPPQATSALTAGSNWASGSALRGDGPAAPWQPPDLPFPVAPSLPARDRRLNPREYPSLSAAAASRQANVLKQPVPSVPDTSGQRSSKWDEDERQLPSAAVTKAATSEWVKERGGFEEEERYGGSVWGGAGAGGDRDWRGGEGFRGPGVDQSRYGGGGDRWMPGGPGGGYPPLAPRRFDGGSQGYDRFGSGETDYVGYGAVDDPVLFPPIGPPRPPPPPPRGVLEPDVLKETDAEKEAFLAELDRVAAELEKEKQRKKEEREAKLAEEAAAAAEAEEAPPEPVREPPQTAAQAVVVGVVLPPTSNEPAAPDSRPETAAEARARAAAVRRLREEAEEDEERKRKEKAAAKLRDLELRIKERELELAKQQEEEEAKKREEEEAAAAAAAISGVSQEAETVSAQQGSLSVASRMQANTDDTELEDSLLGSSIDVRATSSVAQDHLTTSNDDSGPEAGSEVRSLPSAPSSVSEAMHASPLSAWDKPIAPIPNGPVPLPRALSPVLPPPTHVVLQASAEVISPMFDSSTDSFGPDAIAVSITEEILSETQDAPMAIVSSAAQLPLPPPVTAPVAAPAAPPAKPMAPPAAPMSWSSIVTGNQEEPAPPPPPEPPVVAQRGGEGRGAKAPRGRGRDRERGQGGARPVKDGELQGERAPRDGTGQRSREPKERGPRGGARGVQAVPIDGVVAEGESITGDVTGKRPPRQRGPKPEQRAENPTTPTGSTSDTSAPPRARRNNRAAPAQGAPPQAAPRAVPIAVPASIVPRPPAPAPARATATAPPPGSGVQARPVAAVPPPAPLLVQPPPGLPPPPPPVVHTPVGPPGLVPHGQTSNAGWGHTLGVPTQRSTTVVTNPAARQAWESYNPQANHPRQPPGILSPTLDPTVAPRAAVSDTGDGALKAHTDRAIERIARPASAGSSTGFDVTRPKLPSDLGLRDPVPPHTPTSLQAHALVLGLQPQNPGVMGLNPPPAIPFAPQFGFHQQPPPQQIAQVWANDQPTPGVRTVAPPPPPQVSNTSSPVPRANALGGLPFGYGPVIGNSAAPHSHNQLAQSTPAPPPPPPQQSQQQHEQQQLSHMPFQFGQMQWNNTPFIQTGLAPDWSNKGVVMASQGANNQLHNNAGDAVVSGPANAFRHPPPGLGAPGPPGGALAPPGLPLRGSSQPLSMSPLPPPPAGPQHFNQTQLDLPPPPPMNMNFMADTSLSVSEGPVKASVALPDDIFSPEGREELAKPAAGAKPAPGRVPNGPQQGRRGGPSGEGGRRGRGPKGPGGRNEGGRGFNGRGGRGRSDGAVGSEGAAPVPRAVPRENGEGGPSRGGGRGGRGRGDRGRASGPAAAKAFYVPKGSGTATALPNGGHSMANGSAGS